MAERYLPYAKTRKRSWETDETMLRNHLLPVFADFRTVLDLVEPLALGNHPGLCPLAQPPGRDRSRIGVSAAG